MVAQQWPSLISSSNLEADVVICAVVQHKYTLWLHRGTVMENKIGQHFWKNFGSTENQFISLNTELWEYIPEAIWCAACNYHCHLYNLENLPTLTWNQHWSSQTVTADPYRLRFSHWLDEWARFWWKSCLNLSGFFWYALPNVKDEIGSPDHFLQDMKVTVPLKGTDDFSNWINWHTGQKMEVEIIQAAILQSRL